MKEKEQIKTVAELIASPESWIKEASFGDGDGHKWTLDHDRPKGAKACQFCLEGAIQHVYGSDIESYYPVYAKLRKVIGQESIHSWNDDEQRTHSEVLAKVKEAGI